MKLRKTNNSKRIPTPQNKKESQKSYFKLIIYFVVVAFSIILFIFWNQNKNISKVSIQQIETQLEHQVVKAVQEFHHLRNHIPTQFHKRRFRVGYAITITKDGFFQDGAAVWAYSIAMASRDKDYDISFIAFVHPSVKEARPLLKNLGFHIIEVPTPINVSAINYTFLREKINKNGCCGASELIKLSSYRLTQYDKIVHMDADTYLLNNIDELLTQNISLIYSTDPNMASHQGQDKLPVQGGFLVIQPSFQDYRNLIGTIMTTEFRMGSAWNGSKIGWFWGGMTVQGILPYYYNRITTPNRSLIVDRCLYNTMADTPECLNKTLLEIKSAHFTVCQKPWICLKNFAPYNPLCEALHQKWFELRFQAEKFFGLTPERSPCPSWGHKSYRTMKLESARFPTSLFSPSSSSSSSSSSFSENKDSQNNNFQFRVRIIPDDSPDLLEPVSESRYLTRDYDMYVGGKHAAPPPSVSTTLSPHSSR